MKKNNNYEEYIPKSPLEILKNFEEKEDFKEVLFTFGNEEIIKDNGKYKLDSVEWKNRT